MLLLKWYWISSPGAVLRLPGRAAYNTLPLSAEVKNEWSYAFAPPICPHDVEWANLTFIGTTTSKQTEIIKCLFKIK